MRRILRALTFAVMPCIALAISNMPLAAADIPPDRLPDDYTDDGKAVWYPILTPKPISQWEGEFGARYFPSSGKTKINLVGPLPFGLVSRLTFSGLTAHSGELFGKVEHISGFFVKGFVGGGAVNAGKLQDEDFPPLTFPYSSTDSQQRDGRLIYGTFDTGYEWRSENLRLGFFLGYFYYSERLNAFGCTQTAMNPGLCGVFPEPSSINVLSLDTTWNAVRLGANTTWIFGNGLSLMTEFAWLPYARLSASDFHWLRDDLIKPVRESAVAVFNVQLEALLNYQFTPNFAAGIGARYWRIGSDGTSGERDLSFAGLPVQLINFRTERYGGFVQASYKFGDLRPSRY